MIIVIASAIDDEAISLVDRWRSDIAILTPLDMSCSGWRIELGEPDSHFVAAGTRCSSREVTGVLSRLPAVPATEMLVVTKDDREYAACEATATLAWWLGNLRCPVVNVPTPASLTGPSRHLLHWRSIAEVLGIPTHPALHDPLAAADIESVTWCGVLDGEPYGNHDQDAARQARALAATGVNRLSAFGFDQRTSSLCAVSQIPPLTDDLLDRLDEVFA